MDLSTYFQIMSNSTKLKRIKIKNRQHIDIRSRLKIVHLVWGSDNYTCDNRASSFKRLR